MDKHTPEWTYEVHQLSEGYSGIVYDEHGQMVADHLSEERARLIAASNDMLAALEAELADLEQDIRWAESSSDLARLIERRERLEAVITKATNGVIHG